MCHNCEPFAAAGEDRFGVRKQLLYKNARAAKTLTVNDEKIKKTPPFN